jgi:hypothetical protein
MRLRGPAVRLLLLLLFGSAAALGAASAAPVPKDGEKPVLYFPTQVGTKMELKDEARDWWSAGKITASETKDGVTTVIIEWEFFNKQDGRRPLTEKVAVSAKGVARLAYGQQVLDPPFYMLKLPIKKGDKWDTTFKTQSGKSEGQAVAGELEEVKTPAGTFKAVPVHFEYTIDKVTRRMTHWYAPQVGLVQHSSTGYDGVPVIQVLKTFAPPRP